MRRMFLMALAFWLAGCATPTGQQQTPRADRVDVAAFIDSAERELERLDEHETLSYYLLFTDRTADHAKNVELASEFATDRRVALAKAAFAIDPQALSDEHLLKLARIKTAITLPAPADASRSARMAELKSLITAIYSAAGKCEAPATCRNRSELYEVFAGTRDPVALADAWTQWRSYSVPNRAPFAELVDISNVGARELGYRDLGELWRSHYDIPPGEFEALYQQMWRDIQPLYEALHCHARARLHESYGALVPLDDLIPVHLLGRLWASNWQDIGSLIAPPDGGQRIDITRALQDAGYTPVNFVRTAESFFKSLGFAALPDAFWTTAMFAEPEDRDVNCHGTAYDVNGSTGDVRMTMCVNINEFDFQVAHHEVGHLYYYLAYGDKPFLFRRGANPAFQEAIGDAISLSVTPAYLQAIDLVDQAPDEASELSFLFHNALRSLPDLASRVTLDTWRWGVFSGAITPDRYNEAYWDLHAKNGGYRPPAPRSEVTLDPAMIYQVPNNVPTERYFLATILQYDIHRALCEAAGHTGPLHRCSIYGSKEAGARLKKALALGASAPWPDVLEVLTGRRTLSASSMVDYFAPVMAWLEEQNEDRQCGWSR